MFDVEKYTEDGLSGTGVMDHLRCGWGGGGSEGINMNLFQHLQTSNTCLTCLAKNISSNRLSCTMDPWGSSPARHLYKKIRPCTGLYREEKEGREGERGERRERERGERRERRGRGEKGEREKRGERGEIGERGEREKRGERGERGEEGREGRGERGERERGDSGEKAERRERINSPE